MTTPFKVARAWAKTHPDQTALLCIAAGRRDHTYVAVKGQVAAYTSVHVTPFSATAHNGRCEVCGTFSLTPDIGEVWGTDPDAGRPVEDTHTLAWLDGRIFQANLAYVNACPTCQAAHGLRIDIKAADRAGWQGSGDRFLEVRRHPLAQYAESDVTVYLEV